MRNEIIRNKLVVLFLSRRQQVKAEKIYLYVGYSSGPTIYHTNVCVADLSF